MKNDSSYLSVDRMHVFTRRMVRGCALLMALAAAGVVVAYGFTWWALTGALLLLACPVAVLWASARLDAPRQAPAGSARSGGSP